MPRLPHPPVHPSTAIYRGCSLEREAESLSRFFVLAVAGDSLGFECNPDFGLGRCRRDRVSWFKSWSLGLPSCSIGGAAFSLACTLAGALLPGGGGSWAERARRWAKVFFTFLLPALAILGISKPGIRRKASAAPVASDRSV